VILLVAVLLGGITGLGIARWQGRTWRPPVFHLPALAIIGFLPQYFAFYLPATSRLFPDKAASVCLVASQAMLLAFAWWNRSLPGMTFLMLGLGCNLAVILANGGFMPLPLETAARLASREFLDSLEIGGRIGHSSKDILLPDASIRLPWLADRFHTPPSLPYRVAFSAGDVLIALGAFRLLSQERSNTSQNNTGDIL
jgi:hypothetical protein